MKGIPVLCESWSTLNVMVIEQVHSYVGRIIQC